MPLSRDEAAELFSERLMPAFRTERERLDTIDKWWRWDHDPPHQPRQSTREYRELSRRAQAPWLGLVVTSVAQNLYVVGYRQEGANDDAASWDWWQANGLDDRQTRVHRAALGYGLAYMTVLPGEDELTGDPKPVMRGYSPRRMMAFYAEPEHDDWPMFAIQVDKASDATGKMSVRLYDDTQVHFLTCDAMGNDADWIDVRDHGAGVCPVVRFTNQMDLEGRTPGEVEPLIPLAGRIDQTTFDRLVVQRFSSWIVRTIAGMNRPDDESEAAAEKLRLKVEDLLVAEDADTKFGSLPATPLDGFIKAFESDIYALAAVSQTPAHELVGQMVNLSAEALAAARAALMAKVEERRVTFGESWEQALRLAAWVMGDADAARDQGAQVQWRDTEIRSLAQAADALGKMAQMLHVPVEMLWERIPGFTQQDVDRAIQIVQEGDSISDLVALLDRQATEPVAAG